jgi:copper chaperone CopZ
VPGVTAARVEWQTGEAVIDFDPKRATVQDLIAMVENTGFKARLP